MFKVQLAVSVADFGLRWSMSTFIRSSIVENNDVSPIADTFLQANSVEILGAQSYTTFQQCAAMPVGCVLHPAWKKQSQRPPQGKETFIAVLGICTAAALVLEYRIELDPAIAVDGPRRLKEL